MRFIVLISLLSFSSFGRSTLDQIISNKPTIKRSYAKRIAESIDKYSDLNKIPANVMAAIAMVESSYVLSAHNKKSRDYGLFQINSFNIKHYKFDKKRLVSDIDYSVMAGVKVFSWFYYRYSLDDAISRYNCGTRHRCPKWKSVRRYLKKVKRFM